MLDKVTELQKCRYCILQINKTDHSSCSNVCDTCKSAGVTYLHLNYASAKKCADVMAEEIRNIEK